MESPSSAQKRIRELERIVETQNVLIEALVEQNKRFRGADSAHTNGYLDLLRGTSGGREKLGREGAGEGSAQDSGSCTHSSGSTSVEEQDVYGENGRAQSSRRLADGRSEDDPADGPGAGCGGTERRTDDLVDAARHQIVSLLGRRTPRPLPFRPAFTFKEFFAYCSRLGYKTETCLEKLRIASGVKNYIDLNKRSLVYYFSENMDTMPLHESFCFLAVLSRAVDLPTKLAVFYNLLLVLSNPHLLLHLAYPVFCDEKPEATTVWNTTRKILCFQLSIDTSVFADQRIRDSLGRIAGALSLVPAKEDLAGYTTRMLDGMSPDLERLGEDDACEIFSLQLVCLFLDWEWCFEFLVRRHLYEAFANSRDPKILYLIGTAASVGLALVGRHASVMAIFDEMKAAMGGEDAVLGLVGCYFVERVDPMFSRKWLAANAKELGERGTKLSLRILCRPPLF